MFYTGLLGPVNDVLKEIEKRVNISEFKNKHGLKGKGIGGDLQGPTIKGLIKDNSKLKELHDIVTKVDRNMVLFVEYLKNLHKLNEIANSKLLDIDEAKCVLQILRTNYYMLLHEYDLSETLKMHIICAHYKDIFELTEKTLLKVQIFTLSANHFLLSIFPHFLTNSFFMDLMFLPQCLSIDRKRISLYGSHTKPDI